MNELKLFQINLNISKYLTINNKSKNTEFRRLLFKSQFFKPEVYAVIYNKKIYATMSAVLQYNLP